jgi:hypothetical protein
MGEPPRTRVSSAGREHVHGGIRLREGQGPYSGWIAPWNVGRQAVILNEFDLSIKPADIRFEELTIWARILNLPFSLMNDQRGKSLAECVGAVKKMDVDEKGRAWGEYLRFRVTIKVAEPLMRCVSTFSQKGRLLMCMR